MAARQKLSPGEELLARIVEAVSRRDDARDLGPRTVHDHNDGVRLSIDLTYDQATPPVALELTTVQDDGFLATTSYTRKAADRLSTLAQNEHLGCWEVTVSEDGHLADMEEQVLELVRVGREFDESQLTSDDYFRWESEGRLAEELDLLRRMTAAGIAQVRRLDATRDSVAVNTWGSSRGDFDGVADLDAVIASNVGKIAAAGREGQLAVGVGRFRISSDPSRTPVPELPAAISRLWMVRLWWQPEIGYRVWSHAPHGREWTIHAPVFLT